MGTALRRYLKWLRYSGFSVIITLNPCHWRFLPWAYREHRDWPGPNEHCYATGWLFLTARIWIDDGSW